jgi:hypothetical protein
MFSCEITAAPYFNIAELRVSKMRAALPGDGL